MKATTLCLSIVLTIYACLLHAQAQPASTYLMGAEGESCFQACLAQGLNCNANVVTNNTIDLFTKLGVKCTPDPDPWWAGDQPSYVEDPKDPNAGKCLGYVNVPTGVHCGGSFPAVQRLCRCDKPTTSRATFGNGVSAGSIDNSEQYVFTHVVAPGDYGVLTHFWFTIINPAAYDIVVRYYIDGETTASIEFQPAFACGVAFNDTTAPWGTKWIGKGAADGSFFHNIRVPFQKSVAVTAQHPGGPNGGFYMILRGSTNLPFNFGNVPVPTTARLRLFTVTQHLSPLELVTIASMTSGSGAVFLHALAVSSGNMNFLEGCYHWFTPDYPDFPGVVISTGTEDYYDSGWYFNAGGLFHLPTAGLTHLVQSNGVQFSAYRFHEQDPLIFNNGFAFVWRNGDVVDAAGIKCLTMEGKSVGDPQPSDIQSYVWVYTW